MSEPEAPGIFHLFKTERWGSLLGCPHGVLCCESSAPGAQEHARGDLSQASVNGSKLHVTLHHPSDVLCSALLCSALLSSALFSLHCALRAAAWGSGFKMFHLKKSSDPLTRVMDVFSFFVAPQTTRFFSRDHTRTHAQRPWKSDKCHRAWSLKSILRRSYFSDTVPIVRQK